MGIIENNQENLILINWLMKENGQKAKLRKKGHVIHATMYQPIFRIIYMIWYNMIWYMI